MEKLTIEISEEWLQKIEQAQHEPSVTINDKEYESIPYGSEDEDWGADDRSCRDCDIHKGQLHVPSCCVERCPSCNGQMISCTCEYAEGNPDLREARQASNKILGRTKKTIIQRILASLQGKWWGKQVK